MKKNFYVERLFKSISLSEIIKIMKYCLFVIFFDLVSTPVLKGGNPLIQ